MYSLIIKPRAILMTKDAYEWYEEQKPGLGEEFLMNWTVFTINYQHTRNTLEK